MNLSRTTLRTTVAALSTVSVFALPVAAEGTRHADAHVHGTGHLNIAVEGSQIAMELRAPGADIVGFEYAPESDADKKAVENAIALLSDPLALFVLPDAAGCKVVEAGAELHGEDHDEEHGHDDHAHDDHDHDDHKDAHKDEHAHNEHSHEEEHDHNDHAHEEEHAEHSEFHAEYLLDCAAVETIDKVEMAYFKTFENAKALEIQMVTPLGATQVELHHDDPYLVIGAN
jgi:hypothetical protein